MAKKINVKLIMELRDAGLSRNMIAATRHMSKNSVGDVIHIADQKGITFSDVRGLDEDAVYRMFYPDKFAVETLYAQPDYGYIHQELKRTGVTLKLLWQEYQDRCSADGGIPMGWIHKVLPGVQQPYCRKQADKPPGAQAGHCDRGGLVRAGNALC